MDRLARLGRPRREHSACADWPIVLEADHDASVGGVAQPGDTTPGRQARGLLIGMRPRAEDLSTAPQLNTVEPDDPLGRPLVLADCIESPIGSRVS